MSAESRPISPGRFAQALKDLPVSSLYAKAHELQNSVAHLRRSNEELKSYSASQAAAGGDRDCLEAVAENEVVIQRMLERVQLVRAEMERRGRRWHEADPGEIRQLEEEVVVNGYGNGAMVGGGGERDAGAETESHRSGQRADTNTTTGRHTGGRLDDEELARQLLERMDEGDDGEDGMHL